MSNVFVALTQELPTKEEEDATSVESVGKQKLKRGGTAKSKMKKASKYEILLDTYSFILVVIHMLATQLPLPLLAVQLCSDFMSLSNLLV